MWDLNRVHEAFRCHSLKTADRYPELSLTTPQQILRQDIICVLETAMEVPQLSKFHLGRVARCFTLDGNPLIEWNEFKEGFLVLDHILRPRSSGGMSTRHTPPLITKRPLVSHARLKTAIRKGQHSRGTQGSDDPAVSSLAIGWHAAAATTTTTTTTSSSPSFRFAIRGSDVTKGKEGTTLETIFGPDLGRTL